MRIVRTEIENVGGIERIAIDHTSPVMLVSGDNGTGKTSIAQAYEMVFDGGSRPDYIRKGAKKAVVTLTFDDGTTVRRVQTDKSGEYTVTNSAGAVIRSPANFVQSLVSGMALNPMAFITADKKKRVEILHQVVCIGFTKAELDDAAGYDTFYPKQDISLDEFDSLLEGIRLKRRDANATVKTIEATLDTLKQSLPPADTQQTDWAAEVAQLDTTVHEAECEIASLESAGHRSLAEALENARREFDRQCEQMRIAAAVQLAEQRAPVEDRKDAAIAALATARVRQQEAARMAGAAAQVEKLDKQHGEALHTAGRYDRAVSRLQALRMCKLAQSPIAGVEVRNGDLYFEDLNFDTQLNRQRQIFVACRIVAKADRGLNFFVLDEFGSVTEDNRDEFYAAVKEAGFQIVSMVPEKGKPLTVEAK